MLSFDAASFPPFRAFLLVTSIRLTLASSQIPLDYYQLPTVPPLGSGHFLWTYSPDISPPGQFPPLLHDVGGVGHFSLSTTTISAVAWLQIRPELCKRCLQASKIQFCIHKM